MSANVADSAPEKVMTDAVADPVPRLMIKKMVMENFKSYGGIREIGPFHKCFSSVVGPNGRYVF
jgi:structural maintenance of chromosome 4